MVTINSVQGGYKNHFKGNFKCKLLVLVWQHCNKLIRLYF